MKTDIGMITGLLDIVAAATIMFGIGFPTSGDFFFAFGILMLLKALLNFYRFKHINPVPWLDVIAGIIIILLSFGIKSSLFLLVAILELVKGMFAFLSVTTLG